MAELNCRLVRPDRLLFEGPIASIVLASYTGELGILPNHSSLMCALGDGVVRITRTEAEGGGMYRVLISGGYASVHENEVVILADHARAIDDIEVEQVNITRAQAEKSMNEFPEGDHNRAYYANKIKWCDMLLEHAHDLDKTPNHK